MSTFEIEGDRGQILAKLLKSLPTRYKFKKEISVNLISPPRNNIYLVTAEEVSYIICPDDKDKYIPETAVKLKDTSDIPYEAVMGNNEDKKKSIIKESFTRLSKYIEDEEILGDMKRQIRDSSKTNPVTIVRLYPKRN